MALDRSICYDEPRGESEANLALTRRIDELYTRWPLYGSRRIADELRLKRKRLIRLMEIDRVCCEFPRLGSTPGRPWEKPEVIRADQGYASRDLLSLLSECRIEAEIPQRGNDAPAGHGKRRWPIERAIAWLKQYRTVGVRRDRKATNYNAFVQLAQALIAYKQLVALRF